MNDPTPSKITRLSELPRDIAPPRDGWPALEALLRESGAPGGDLYPRRAPSNAGSRPWRRYTMRIAAVAAVLAAVAVGISIDRLLLTRSGSTPVGVANIGRGVTPGGAAHADGTAGAGLPASYISDPRYLRERAALLRSLDAKLASLPPPTRQKVLSSLATIHRSMQDIQQALGREPGNALLQELLVNTYQDEMRVLTAVQEASAGSGET